MAALLPLLLGVFVSSAHSARGDRRWAKLAEGDLGAMRRILEADHPGPVDQENPAFRDWLEKGYARAMERARGVATPEGHLFALRYYASGFKDGHLGVSPKSEPKTARWPGFVVSRRGGRTFVHSSSVARPARGVELLSCGGRGVERLFREDVFPYRGDESLPGDWVWLAPLLMVDRGNPWVPRYSSCRFRDAAGEVELPLAWREISEADLEPLLRQAAFGKRPEAGIRLFPGGVWVSLPDFSPDAAGARRLNEVLRRVPSLRPEPVIVVDARGNQGGNSAWGALFVEALFGKEYVQSLRISAAAEPGRRPLAVDWRVSEGNRRHVEGLLPKLRAQFGPRSEIADEFTKVAAGLAQGGRTLFRQEPAAEAPAARGSVSTASAARGTVLFVTDGRCASACLDFADEMLRVPGVVHLGSPTGADSQYMEAREVELPSGAAGLYFAIKVYRNRPRAAGQYYAPKREYDGDWSDEEAFEAWVAQTASKL